MVYGSLSSLKKYYCYVETHSFFLGLLLKSLNEIRYFLDIISEHNNTCATSCKIISLNKLADGLGNFALEMSEPRPTLTLSRPGDFNEFPRTAIKLFLQKRRIPLCHVELLSLDVAQTQKFHAECTLIWSTSWNPIYDEFCDLHYWSFNSNYLSSVSINLRLTLSSFWLSTLLDAAEPYIVYWLTCVLANTSVPQQRCSMFECIYDVPSKRLPYPQPSPKVFTGTVVPVLAEFFASLR